MNDFYKMYAYIICLLKGRWRNMHIMFILIHKYIYIHTPSVLPFWYITILQSNGFFELLPPGLCWDRVMSQWREGHHIPWAPQHPSQNRPQGKTRRLCLIKQHKQLQKPRCSKSNVLPKIVECPVKEAKGQIRSQEKRKKGRAHVCFANDGHATVPLVLAPFEWQVLARKCWTLLQQLPSIGTVLFIMAGGQVPNIAELDGFVLISQHGLCIVSSWSCTLRTGWSFGWCDLLDGGWRRFQATKTCFAKATLPSRPVSQSEFGCVWTSPTGGSYRYRLLMTARRYAMPRPRSGIPFALAT